MKFIIQSGATWRKLITRIFTVVKKIAVAGEVWFVSRRGSASRYDCAYFHLVTCDPATVSLALCGRQRIGFGEIRMPVPKGDRNDFSNHRFGTERL